jgi:hypothetical protein
METEAEDWWTLQMAEVSNEQHAACILSYRDVSDMGSLLCMVILMTAGSDPSNISRSSDRPEAA